MCIKLVQLIETTVKHNATSALLVIGIAIMLCHYRQIVNTFGGFPIVFACGPTETGKLTSLRAGLSLTGGQKNAFYANCTKQHYFLERTALSCLPFGVDNSNMLLYGGRKQLDVGELVVDLYNGAKTANLRTQWLSAAVFHALNCDQHPPKDDPRCVKNVYKSDEWWLKQST